MRHIIPGLAPAPGAPKLDNENVEVVNDVVVDGRVELSEPDVEDTFVASAGFVEIGLDVSGADKLLQTQYVIKQIIRVFRHKHTIEKITDTCIFTLR